MPGPTVVRAARPSDAEPVATIYIDSWNAGFGDLLGMRALDEEQTERWRATLADAPPQRWWVAERAAEIVGFAGVGPSRDPIDAALGELDTIAVAPNHWRSGAGRALMDVALRALAADYREAIVWTVAAYDRGRHFYEATGWHRTETVRANGREVSFRRMLVDVGSGAAEDVPPPG